MSVNKFNKQTLDFIGYTSEAIITLLKKQQADKEQHLSNDEYTRIFGNIKSIIMRNALKLTDNRNYESADQHTLTAIEFLKDQAKRKPEIYIVIFEIYLLIYNNKYLDNQEKWQAKINFDKEFYELLIKASEVNLENINIYFRLLLEKQWKCLQDGQLILPTNLLVCETASRLYLPYNVTYIPYVKELASMHYESNNKGMCMGLFQHWLYFKMHTGESALNNLEQEDRKHYIETSKKQIEFLQKNQTNDYSKTHGLLPVRQRRFIFYSHVWLKDLEQALNIMLHEADVMMMVTDLTDNQTKENGKHATGFYVERDNRKALRSVAFFDANILGEFKASSIQGISRFFLDYFKIVNVFAEQITIKCFNYIRCQDQSTLKLAVLVEKTKEFLAKYKLIKLYIEVDKITEKLVKARYYECRNEIKDKILFTDEGKANYFYNYIVNLLSDPTNKPYSYWSYFFNNILSIEPQDLVSLYKQEMQQYGYKNCAGLDDLYTDLDPAGWSLHRKSKALILS